ncbi:16S rRNA (guanine(527)-N(7))-methyltransferase RsmG [Sediminivirga luteola]|uniref:Ribosomal RNA small subunit methyltransferase G n=1 Tax=Sediminivirga luteola TaxID=1774748 RepID=A0A8J2TZG7_9MICO|nr:16S rRNA (guanine(527)-N(7))-methyltransferase RsmG [Sediminivirga luteola]MCI2266622.1 16S rRNA (guanine(527)-N(7))-methyltransferase RsmG [Sediminivirga luteola]GGA20227.1 ribosomal RNA small subunit methyltransferase G [Sediminivirga luteola]
MAAYFGAAGSRRARIEQYVGHLSTTGVSWGLIGPRELPRIWTRHVLNCAAVGELFDPEGEQGPVADLGSGAGLPGLVLAIARPDVSITLIEPLERRVEWLEMVCDDLGVDNVRVVRARAEDLVDEEIFSAVTSRAVKALSGLVPWTAPLLSPGGRMLAMKGRSAEDEIEKAGKTLRRLRLDGARVVTVGAAVLAEPSRVVVATRR